MHYIIAFLLLGDILRRRRRWLCYHLAQFLYCTNTINYNYYRWYTGVQCVRSQFMHIFANAPRGRFSISPPCRWVFVCRLFAAKTKCVPVISVSGVLTGGGWTHRMPWNTVHWGVVWQCAGKVLTNFRASRARIVQDLSARREHIEAESSNTMRNTM